MAQALTVVRQPRFEAEMEAIEPDPILADAFAQGTEWLLCRYPRYGEQIAPNSRVWFVPILDMGGEIATPNYSIYYTFNETTVFLMSIKHIDEADDEDW